MVAVSKIDSCPFHVYLQHGIFCYVIRSVWWYLHVMLCHMDVLVSVVPLVPLHIS
jgi:hypothetical protein